jgi:predicted TIM-barrel fold metal-dependent hydrolase
MDAMGVERSLLFPSFGLIGFLMANSPEFVAAVMGLGLDVPQTRQTGLDVIKAYNEWAVRGLKHVDGRVRPVALLLTESLEQMTRDLNELIDQGIGAVWIPSGHPPAGTSPADPALDEFWRTAADANVPVLLHIGTDFTFAASLAWTANVSAFIPPRASAEFVLSPFAGATVAAAAEHFIAAMVLGGVFERVPNLRFAAIELGAQWYGPLAERLDQWADVFPNALHDVISMRPSEYMARNIRVAPFHFEAIDDFIERHPNLVDSYCFSSDYPHVEGGRDARKVFSDRLERLGPAVSEKFFRTNGEWLLPAEYGASR